MPETDKVKEARLMKIIESGRTVSSEDADWLWEHSADYHDLNVRSYSDEQKKNKQLKTKRK